MKDTFVTRPLDRNGRVVIPMEIRRQFKIHTNDLLSISIEGRRIVIEKHEPGCIFCGSSENTVYFHEKTLCEHCIKSLQEAF